MDYVRVPSFSLAVRLGLLLSVMLTATSTSSPVSPHPQAPVFVVEPDPVYYVVKGRPVTLTCRAAPAIQISVKCGGQWISPTRQVNDDIVDPSTGVTYLQTSVDIDKDQVDDQLSEDDYQCECHAWNNVPHHQPLLTRSSKATIHVAYLRKRFEQEPINSHVEATATVQLQCLPPSGLPAPQVFWLKDGERIDVQSDVNFIISHEGSLIVSQARLTDSGNYTCGAQNIAGRRLSESAILTVYMNGAWSAWSSWSDCSTRCVKGTQRRTRTCNNPGPVNGGAPCVGESSQRVPCTVLCPVDGGWSTWASWSTCSSDCRHHRRRTCDNPEPQHHGQYCEGTDLNTGNCTGGYCRVRQADAGNTAMYAGLAVAVLIFLVVVIFIVCLVRRRLPLFISVNNKASAGLTHAAEMSLAPDLTKTAVISMSSPLDRSASDSPNSSVSDRARDSIVSTQRLLPYSTPAAAATDPATSTARRSTRHRCPRDVTLPSNLDADALVWSTVTSSGGRVTLPGSGVSMTIPEGAVRQDESVDVYLAVLRDDKDRPKLTDVQTVLSAVVMCGPPSVRLDKPVILSFPHCASVKHGHWTLSVFTGHSDFDEPPAWHAVCELGRETINTPVYVQMDASECHVMTDNLARYTLTGEPRTPTSRAVKILRLAAFAPHLPTSVDFNLRVYFVEDTQDALEGVMQVERRLGGYLLDKPKQMLFHFTAGNLCVSIEDFSPGWRCKQNANYQEIPFRHIWNGTQNGLHCSFALEHVDRSETQLTCNILVCQAETSAGQQVIHISSNVAQNLHSSVSQYALLSDSNGHTSTVNESGFVSLDPPSHVFRLPGHVKRQLCDILDPPNSRGNDWRMLAQRLSVDRYINYFATKLSPTEHILDLWEARHREDSAITDLMNSLRVMSRMDAAALIETELGIASWL